MTDSLTIERDGAVARLVLNRPDKGNALDQPLADALAEAALSVATDRAVRAVVLTGAGRLFCAGGDVDTFAEAGDHVSAFLTRLAGVVHVALGHFATMDKPLITLVNGPAAGAGLSLAISGDVVLAAPDAHFTPAYLGIGLTPDGGMTWLLPRLVGMRRAQEMILTNTRVGAEEAARIGLISRVVDDGTLEEEGARIADRMARGAVGAMGQARRLLHASHATGFAQQMEAETRAIAAAGAGAEGREGVSAYLAGRKPDFVNGGDHD
ncbi:enoyl-CoA hydratase/isomerase family protein [Pseudooceanicola aestuarii]|uniref:enoyl-CoA hydratase/isomerase family protein n=1 Tax=Pseudooceanicola aestuarii TaxID=2697319 RepID=UPI0013CF839B|nr:enoyl-CoA hydratase-related protein [Pseudooceanicola aestuarii]